MGEISRKKKKCGLRGRGGKRKSKKGQEGGKKKALEFARIKTRRKKKKGARGAKKKKRTELGAGVKYSPQVRRNPRVPFGWGNGVL